MMQQNTLYAMIVTVLLVVPCVHAHEFVKEKVKKESSTQVKQDIAELLESAVRQLGNNIKESVTVQNQMFDQIKEIMGDSQQSTAQLKELRKKLEACLKNLEDQQAELHTILLTCK
ncbi:MAG: hypothetical protein Q8Q60_01895 [Candidatus Chromulinivorax sp.]|nr:hypothetical protein [Candidatus Chromulinivorax sp.]